MKLRRLLPLALAGVVTASLAAPAFAANETEITVGYQEVELNVTVPETGTAYINPYGLPIDLDDTNKSSISKQQITTIPMAIANLSKVKLDVGATAVATLSRGSTMELVSAAPAANETAKQAFIELQVAKAGNGVLDTDKDTVYPEYVKDASWTSAGKLTIGTESASNTAILSGLTAATANQTTGEMEVAAGGIAFVRLSGSCVESPADDPWSDKDGLTVSVAFTFKPSTTP